jgi:sugar phosphate isomerase/epimerase
MKSIPVGLQLYSVREDCARDLPATLAAVAKMGYTGVEFAGYYQHSARELRGMLDDLGLKCCGSHIGLNTLLGDELAATVAFNLELGNPYLVVPWIGEERRNSTAAWQATAALFTEIAAKLSPHNLHLGYHNHHMEFEALDGSTGFEVFYTSAGADVFMQLDLGNAMVGGADALDYLRRFNRRAVTIHLKEYSAGSPDAVIGEGEVDWPAVFKLCEDGGVTQWYIVEQESHAVSPLESAERCRVFLKGMGR